jgi:hypothetical protein
VPALLLNCLHGASTPAGECSAEELERLMTIVANPTNYKIPTWFLNRQKDYKTGRFSQVGSLLGAGIGWQ